MNPRDEVYLRHILQASHQIGSYTADLDRERFLSESIVQDAVIRQLEIIGEAAKQVSADLRTQYASQVRWRSMAGMRDRLIHGYFGVDLDAVWETVQHDVPDLIDAIEAILRDHEH